MTKSIYLCLVCMFFSSVSFATDDEITLFDQSGESVIYIDLDDDLAIYIWEGHATAYLDGSLNQFLRGETLDVYGWNGKHLGWYFDGIIMNHNGDASCVTRERHPGPVTEYVKYVKYVQYVKYVSYVAPVEPIFSNHFGEPDCLTLISSGRVD